MNVEAKDSELLLELQEYDRRRMKAKRMRVELPQRNKMAAVKKKQAEFDAKLEQVMELLDKATEALAKVESEDASLADKQKRAQELIDTAGSDFRSVESHSKEMGGFAKRRDLLAQKSEEINGRIQQAEAVKAKIDSGLARLAAEADAIRASFAEEDGKLRAQLAELEEARESITANLDPEALAVYTKTANRTGGVAIGKLNENTCGVCRSVIEGGRLIELRAAAPLGVCPACKRLLVVE